MAPTTPAVLVYRAGCGRTIIDFRLGGLARRRGAAAAADPEARARAQRVIMQYLVCDAPGLVRLINRDVVLDVLKRPWANPGLDVWADGAPLCDAAQPCVVPEPEDRSPDN